MLEWSRRWRSRFITISDNLKWEYYDNYTAWCLLPHTPDSKWWKNSFAVVNSFISHNSTLHIAHSISHICTRSTRGSPIHMTCLSHPSSSVIIHLSSLLKVVLYPLRGSSEENKLASLEARLVRNYYPPTQWLMGVKYRAISSVNKNMQTSSAK